MNPVAEKKLERIQQLLADREDIDRQLEEELITPPGHTPADPVKKTRKPYGSSKLKAGRSPRVYSCKNCGEPGHTSPKCPKGQPHLQVEVRKTELTGEALTEEIRKLRDEEHLDSLRIASKLHITLGTINKHWPPLPQDKDEDHTDTQ